MQGFFYTTAKYFIDTAPKLCNIATMKLKLNTKKVKKLLKLHDRNVVWLAKECKRSRQLVEYWLKSQSNNGAIPIAKVFNLDPKDLIK